MSVEDNIRAVAAALGMEVPAIITPSFAAKIVREIRKLREQMTAQQAERESLLRQLQARGIAA